MSQREVVLLLGSNLGDKKKYIEAAISRLADSGCTIVARTAAVETEAVEFASSNNFCNIALSILTELSPFSLLFSIKKIEGELGRSFDSAYFGEYRDRVIDIDIVKFGNITVKSEKLTLPHRKHLFEREFSAELLKELCLLKTT